MPNYYLDIFSALCAEDVSMSNPIRKIALAARFLVAALACGHRVLFNAPNPQLTPRI
jgi:hypothetical protein